MNSQAINNSFQAITLDYTRLLDSLSALRALSDIDIDVCREDQLLQRSLEILMEYQDLQHATIFVTSHEGLQYAAGSDMSNLAQLSERFKNPFVRLRGEVLPRDGRGLWQVAELGEPLQLAGCQPDQFSSRLGGLEQLHQNGATLLLPIESGSETLGVLVAYYPNADEGFASKRQMLTLFANFLGQMLANLRRARHMEAEIERRTVELEYALIEAHRLKKRFEELSSIDELTGLYNRRYFFPAANAALSHAIRRQKPLAVLSIDLDHFKSINDRHGHAAGDKVLAEAARMFQVQARESDILARFGGEEFVLLLPDTDTEGARQMAERILAAARALVVEADGENIRFTTTIGIATWDGTLERGDDAIDQLLQQSDQALYYGKERGRDQCNAFSSISCNLRS